MAKVAHVQVALVAELQGAAHRVANVERKKRPRRPSTASVASDAPGLRDSVVDGSTGYLVPHGDVEQLADRLTALLADPDHRDDLGGAARRFAERFSWDASAQATEAFLRRLVTASPQR